MRLTAVPLMLLLLPPLFQATAGEERFIDYAVEDAAYQTIRTLTSSGIEAGRIGFAGLFGEAQNLAPVFRAGVVGTPGQFRFFTRDEAEWDTLISEIDFANRRSDVMDARTIQGFGRIRGVEALLYGDIREARMSGGRAVARLAVTLAEVETGEILWSGNVEGVHEVTPEFPPLEANVRRAAIEAARDAAGRLRDWGGGREDTIRVFLIPLEGESGSRITDLMIGELVGAGGERLRFFSPPADSQVRRMLDRMAADLYGPGAASETHRQRIAEQLGQIAAGMPAGEATVPVSAVLMGRVTGITETEEIRGAATRVSASLRMMNPLDHRNLWSANVEGTYLTDAGGDLLTRLRVYTTENLGMIAAAAAAVIVLLFLFSRMARAVTRPR